MTWDLLNNRLVAVPCSELYEAGFPCQPWSLRRGSRTACFEEAKARPYYAVLAEIESGRHDAVCLENVMGLVTRRCRGERVIDIVTRDIRQAARDRYFLSISHNMSPHMFGESVHRPRVIIRLLRKSRSLVSTEEDFALRLTHIETAIADECSERMRQPRQHHANFINCLVHAGARSAQVDEHDASDSPTTAACPCCMPVSSTDGGKVDCRVHTCRCKPCLAGDGGNCTWIRDHAMQWEKLAKPATQLTGYMTEAARRGLPVMSTFTTPRQINMAELIHRKLLSEGVDTWTSSAVYDCTQTYGYHALRKDGLQHSRGEGSWRPWRAVRR